MRKVLFASAAAILMTGSLANAQFLLGQDENGHKQVTNLWAEQEIGGERHTALIAAGDMTVSASTSGLVSPAFLLGEDENGQKIVVNQYAR
jgi:hypothetical protein